MAYSTQVFAQGQENEGQLGKGKEQAVDHGKSTDDEQLEARNTRLVSHTAGICHSLPLPMSQNVSQAMSQRTMSQYPQPPLQFMHHC